MKINTSEGPKYYQIYQILTSRISEDIYQVSSMIPSEGDLVKEFNCSRVTIRKALEALEKKGYIVRKPGFGTIVSSKVPSFRKFTRLKSFSSEMLEQGKQTETMAGELLNIKAGNTLSRIFSIDKSDTIQQINRLRGAEGKPVLYSETSLNIPIQIPNEKNILFGSLYNYLLTNNIEIAKMKEVISAEKVNKQISLLLELRTNFVLCRKRYSYDKSNNIIEYTINYYNPELYKYFIETNSDKL